MDKVRNCSFADETLLILIPRFMHCPAVQVNSDCGAIETWSIVISAMKVRYIALNGFIFITFKSVTYPIVAVLL